MLRVQILQIQNSIFHIQKNPIQNSIFHIQKNYNLKTGNSKSNNLQSKKHSPNLEKNTIPKQHTPDLENYSLKIKFQIQIQSTPEVTYTHGADLAVHYFGVYVILGVNPREFAIVGANFGVRYIGLYVTSSVRYFGSRL